ncbi:WXG100 family type VII secretion target [Streptomyces sp. NPDC001401]|uniref:WXG100 family type VII secretion target n=1 Tax=Streptomyces sp. NPDC001401 TaxID=3364570 RepID=UPI003691BDDB
MSDTAAAYAWTKKEPAPLPPLEDVQPSQEHGLDAGIDDLVRGVLDATGMLDELEKVTGMPGQLSAAAHSWYGQAKALQSLADTLRMGAAKLPEHWEGEASASFGRGMGEFVDAIDRTAEDMGRTAEILNSAAKECKLAEDTVVAIIREAIEMIAMTVAAGLITDLLTAGLATAVDALAVDAEIAIYVERVEQVSSKLGTALRDLMKAVKDMRAGEAKFKDVVKAAKGVRKMSGWRGMGGEGTHKGLVWAAHHEGMKQLKEHVFKPLFGEAPGLTGDPAGPVKEALHSDTTKEALARDQQLAHDQPYRVNKRSIEEDFG